MHSKELKTPQHHLLILQKGEKLVDSITNFCQENHVTCAWISAIGAISKAEIALYDLSTKKYYQKIFNESLEIASLSGNITQKDQKIIAHIHGVFCNKKMEAIGGHLVEAIVSATCEIYFIHFNNKIIREHNEEIGLNLIS